MLKRLTQKERLDQLTVEWEPKIRAEFMASINGIKSKTTLRRVIRALERRDVNAALEAMNVDADAFARLEVALVQAYNQGGQATVDTIPQVRGPDGSRVVFRWSVRNLFAEETLRQDAANLVTRIVADQREAIRNALTEGLANGDNPTRTALNVVGRVNNVTGRREGGIIGLTAEQERYVSNARRQLLSGRRDQIMAYLDRDRRDKRFDRQIMAALKAGKPLSTEAVDKITGRYSDRLLELRGVMLARTETMAALSQSRDDAFRQQVSNGKLEADILTKIWHASKDGRERFTHHHLDGQRVPFDGEFQSRSGARLRYPGDRRAPAREVVACRCWCEYKIDYIARLERRFRAVEVV